MIASGPAYPDSTTCDQAKKIAAKYGLRLSSGAMQCLERETLKTLTNVTTRITGSVRELCAASADAARELGYETHILTDRMNCQAREAGAWLAETARSHYGSGKRIAFMAGGETVVKLTGNGM